MYGVVVLDCGADTGESSLRPGLCWVWGERPRRLAASASGLHKKPSIWLTLGAVVSNQGAVLVS